MSISCLLDVDLKYIVWSNSLLCRTSSATKDSAPHSNQTKSWSTPTPLFNRKVMRYIFFKRVKRIRFISCFQLRLGINSFSILYATFKKWWVVFQFYKKSKLTRRRILKDFSSFQKNRRKKEGKKHNKVRESEKERKNEKKRLRDRERKKTRNGWYRKRPSPHSIAVRWISFWKILWTKSNFFFFL